MKNIAAIKDVQVATEAATAAVIDYLKSEDKPTSERAHEIIDKVLAEHDCESPEGHIVAGGQQAVEPHKQGSGALKASEAIVIDIYPRSKKTGYWADMTRTVCLGEPSPELQAMNDAVLEAQELAMALVAPGVLASDIQLAVEDFFVSKRFKTSGEGKEFQFAEGFVHSIGHGLGKEIHMTPHFGHQSTDMLQEGDVITIEPGLYYHGLGGVRIEDMLLVTKDGYENLTNFSKVFIV